jgi:hypothetical protein
MSLLLLGTTVAYEQNGNTDPGPRGKPA